MGPFPSGEPGKQQQPGLVFSDRMARLGLMVTFSLLILVAFACGELIHGPLAPPGPGPSPEEAAKIFSGRLDGPKITKMSGGRETLEDLSAERVRQLAQHDSGLVDVLKQYLRRQSYRQLYHYQLKRGSLSWKPNFSLTYAPLNGASSNKISDPILPQRKTLWSRIPGPSWAPQPSHTKKSETFDKKVQPAVGEKALDNKEIVQDRECPDLFLLLKAITHMLE